MCATMWIQNETKCSSWLLLGQPGHVLFSLSQIDCFNESFSSFTPFLPPLFFGSALCFHPDFQAVSYSQATQVLRKTVGFSLWSTFSPSLQSLPASQRAWRQGGALPRNWLANGYGSQVFDLISNGEHLAPREPRQTGPRDLLPCVLLKVKMKGNKLDRVSRTSSCGKPIISDLSLKL